MASLDEIVSSLRELADDLDKVDLQHADDCRCEDCWWDDSEEDPLAAEGKSLAEEVRLYHDTNHEGAMQWCLTICKKAHEVLELVRSEPY